MSPRAIVVQQYGRRSLADAGRIRCVARRIAATAESGTHVVAVVSAMGDTNERLMDLAREVSAIPDSRELDMLLSAGEQVCIALLAMALIEEGHDAISLTGEEAGIITSLCHTRARVLWVSAKRVRAALDEGKVVIVAGSQGISPLGEITRLGRGGLKSTAVGLATALGAHVCEVCTDVEEPARSSA